MSVNRPGTKEMRIRHPLNPHKKSTSKYPWHHHAPQEYPKLFWDSSKWGTIRRESKIEKKTE